MNKSNGRTWEQERDELRRAIAESKRMRVLAAAALRRSRRQSELVTLPIIRSVRVKETR